MYATPYISLKIVSSKHFSVSYSESLVKSLSHRVVPSSSAIFNRKFTHPTEVLHACFTLINTSLSNKLVGRAKQAPHWGVQSRFRVIYIYICVSPWAKMRTQNYVAIHAHAQSQFGAVLVIEEQRKEMLRIRRENKKTENHE